MAVVGTSGNENQTFVTETGRYMSDNRDNCNDLINVPVKHVREYWVNLYALDNIQTIAIHYSKEEADKNSLCIRLACKKITISFEEGEGL